MADTKSASKAKRSTSNPPGKRENSGGSSRLRRWFFRPGTLIAASFLASLIVLAPFIPHLLPRLSEQPEYQLSLDQIQVNVPPDWVPSTLTEEVLKGAPLPATVSVLDGDLCRRIGTAFESHPWVAEVRSVQLTGEPAIRVVLEYRVPIAFVETPRGFYPVDVHGVLLPPVDFSLNDTDRLPRIQGVNSVPSGIAGMVWQDVVVRSAARLAAILAPDQDMNRYWRRFGLRAIVAPPVDPATVSPRELTFELVTDGGSRIIWGKPPGADDLEPTAEQKIGRLEQYLSRFGDFDSPDGPYRIDIRLFDAISLEPLERHRG